MRSGPLLLRLPRLLLVRTVELGLLPLRLAAKLVGGLLLLVAVIGVPAWLIQLLISSLGGGSGGGPLPAWAMVLLLAAAMPAGVLSLRIAHMLRALSQSTETHNTRVEDEGRRRDEPADHAYAEPDLSGDETQTVDWAYRTLELEPPVTLVEIKAGFRRLAQLYHPDHNPGFAEQAAERFAAINAAYEALVSEG